MTNTDADAGETPDFDLDGTPCVRALMVTVTNDGQRPITLRYAHCQYTAKRKGGEAKEGKASGSVVATKIGQGDHVDIFIHIGGWKSIELLQSVEVSDSADKAWKVNAEVMKKLNADGPWIR